MKRLHVMLQVRDLEESIRFYSTLFEADPSVRKADYAKWMLDDPRVNFSIAPGQTEVGVEHLGIQAETPQELEQLRQRVASAKGDVRHEGETTCCYHESDKTWIQDAQGVSWEMFYTSGESESKHGPVGLVRSGDGTSCCEPTCCQADG